MRPLAETAPATSALETPGYFDAGEDLLFGIHTRPAAIPNGTGALLLVGGGSVATNRNRLSVELARRLAAEGFHTLRFDWHGVGESAGVLAGRPRLEEPFVADTEGALNVLRGVGVERFVLIGACFGGRSALEVGPDVAGLRSLILLSPPLRDLEMGDEPGIRLAQRVGVWEGLARALRPRAVRGWLDPARRHTYLRFIGMKIRAAGRRIRTLAGNDPGPNDYWVSRHLLDPIRELAKREVPVLFIYGKQDAYYRDFLLAREGRLGRVLERAPLTEVAVVDGPVHGFTNVAAQRQVIRLILEWLDHLDRSERSPTTEVRDPA